MLPGAVLPGDLAYGPLLDMLGEDVEAVVKDLEVYAEACPPRGYGLGTEIDGLLRAAEEAGFESFHLIGYSGGGAVSIAFAAAYPQRLRSLALVEPAWAGNRGHTTAESALWRRYIELSAEGVPDDELMAGFVRLQLRSGVEPPPRHGSPPPWMSKRPPGIRALVGAFRDGDIDPGRLRGLNRPVYFALGELSNPDFWEPMAARLEAVFADFSLEVYEGRHHFDPPHRAEPDRFAAALRQLWSRADDGTLE